MRKGFITMLTAALGLTMPVFAQSPELTLDLGSGAALKLVLIKAGRFTQGSPLTEPDREPDETQHEVTLTRDFYLGTHVVTRGQFARFAQETAFRTEAEKGTSGGYGVVDGALVQRKDFTWRSPGFPQTDEHPVVLVTHDDALAFCRWLSKKSGREVTLPTEAQWEHSARAGSTGARFAEPLDDVAWHKDNSQGMTQPIGTKRANAWGVYDLHGPVWQWCLDWYGPYPDGEATDPLQTNPSLSDKPRRVLRGGSFLSGKSRARSAERYRNDPQSRNADNGFRIVCSVAELPKQMAAPPRQPGYPEPNPPRITREIVPTAQPPAHPLHDIPSALPRSQGMGWMGLLQFGGVVLAIIMIMRKARSFVSKRHDLRTATGLTGQQMAEALSRQSQLGGSFRVQVQDSGFFILGAPGQQGELLRYTAAVGGQTLSDEISFMPGPEGHFIFTGTRPASVTVQTVGAGPVTHEPVVGTSSSSLRRNDRSISTSHPSAY